MLSCRLYTSSIFIFKHFNFINYFLMNIIYSLTIQRPLHIIPLKFFFLSDYYIVFIYLEGIYLLVLILLVNFNSSIAFYIFRDLFC